MFEKSIINFRYVNSNSLRKIGKKFVLMTTLGSLLLTGCSTNDLGKIGNSSSDNVSVVSYDDTSNEVDLTSFKKDIYVDVSGFEYADVKKSDLLLFVNDDKLIIGMFSIENNTEKSNVYDVRADVSYVYSGSMDLEVKLPKIDIDENYVISLDYLNKKIDVNVEKTKIYSR